MLQYLLLVSDLDYCHAQWSTYTELLTFLDLPACQVTQKPCNDRSECDGIDGWPEPCRLLDTMSSR
jgi:hypothetical protein